MSARNAVHIIAATANAFGSDIEQIVLNRESIRKSRNLHRDQISENIINEFSPKCSLTVHWDGKMVRDLRLSKKIERLAVHVSGRPRNLLQCFTFSINLYLVHL